MVAEKFNIFEQYDNLIASGIPAEQARAQLNVLKDTLSTIVQNMATKEDINKLAIATKEDINKLAIATKEDINKLAIATKEDINKLAIATKEDINRLAVATKMDIDKLGKDIDVKLYTFAKENKLESSGTKLTFILWVLGACALTVINACFKQYFPWG